MKKAMRRRFTTAKKFFLGLLTLCLAFGLVALVPVKADAAEYTYSVTFYTGKQGSFAGTSHITIDNSKSGSQYQVNPGEKTIVITGLKRGDIVSFDAAMAGAVDLGESSKYYVKGIRQSGRDNNTVSTPAFTVEKDTDYVVAYGIAGDLTSYVVNYQDADGNELAPSRTYYGNVGDKPVVAFLYVDGYEPQAYNLTKTLSANAAENVFTFVYNLIPEPEVPTLPQNPAGGQASGSGNAANAGAAGTQAGQPGDNLINEGGNDVAQLPGGDDAAAGGAGGAGDAGAGDDAGQGDVNIEDDQTPADQGPDDLVDLDDDQVPLADGGIGDKLLDIFHGEDDSSASMLVWVSAVAALLALIIILLVFWGRLANREKVKTKTVSKEKPEKKK